MSSIVQGNSRKPPKPFDGKFLNVDNKKLTPQERERNVQRKERAKDFMGGDKIKTSKKAIQKESLRNKLGRLEERIEGAAEVILYISTINIEIVFNIFCC